MLDAEGRVTWCNESATRLLGFSEADITGGHCRDLMHGGGIAPPECPLTKTVTSRKRESLELEAGGRVYQITVDPILDDEGNLTGAVHTMVDISEERQTETHLRQERKLEAIGTLAGGVAHEINNPINGIMNYAQLIQDILGDSDDTVNVFAGEIIHGTERVAEIVRNLLRLAWHDKETHSPARIIDIVESALSLVRTVLRRDHHSRPKAS